MLYSYMIYTQAQHTTHRDIHKCTSYKYIALSMSMLLGDKQRAPPLNNRNRGSSGPAVSSGLIWILGGGNETSLREETQNRLQQVVMNFSFPKLICGAPQSTGLGECCSYVELESRRSSLLQPELCGLEKELKPRAGPRGGTRCCA